MKKRKCINSKRKLPQYDWAVKLCVWIKNVNETFRSVFDFIIAILLWLRYYVKPNELEDFRGEKTTPRLEKQRIDKREEVT